VNVMCKALMSEGVPFSIYSVIGLPEERREADRHVQVSQKVYKASEPDSRSW